MPLPDNDLRDVRRRVMPVFLDTVATFELIAKNAHPLFAGRCQSVKRLLA